MRILITELPYLVNKARMIERIAELVRDKKIEGITDLRDESDRTGMRVVIELRKDVNPQIILNQLHKQTQLQDTFGVILLSVVDGQPRVLNLSEMIYYYLEHQKDVVVRRTRFDLKKAEERLHIVEGLKIAIDHIDEVIRIIRSSRDTENSKNNLMERFALTDKQAQAIVDMRLGRLSGLEREKLETEYKDLISKIAFLRNILASEKMVLNIIKDELLEVKEKYGDERRTEIVQSEVTLETEDLIAEEDMVIAITHSGYIKRQPINTYRNQKRGGRGISAITTKEEDFVEHLFITTTHNYLLFFTNKGKVYRLKVYEIPEASRQAKGMAIVNLLYITGEEKITAVIPVRAYEEGQYLLTATKKGIIKKTSLLEYDSSRKDGIIALTLDDADELIGVKLTHGDDEIILATRQGMVIRFSESDVRYMGRTARGVKGISLNAEDEIVSMDTIKDGAELLVITVHGYGKRTKLSEFRNQTRGGKGMIGMRTNSRNGAIVGILEVSAGDEIMLITHEGVAIRVSADDISSMGRVTQGVRIMKLDTEDTVVALARVVVKDEDE
jgi:DNA gyrase subunit A